MAFGLHIRLRLRWGEMDCRLLYTGILLVVLLTKGQYTQAQSCGKQGESDICIMYPSSSFTPLLCNITFVYGD